MSALRDLDDAVALIARARAEIERLQGAVTPPLAPTPVPAAIEPPPPPRRGLKDPAAFFSYVRRRPPLGPSLSQDEVDGCERILAACAAASFPVSWAAYALATAYHETAGTLKPIREYGKGHGKPYGRPGRNGGQVPYGRGDVQLTWDDNYEKMDEALGLGGALVKNYDLALDPAISARIMVRGLEHGDFTGKGLAIYLPETAAPDHFKKARRAVNGTDKADLIAGYAVVFQDGLQAGGWA